MKGWALPLNNANQVSLWLLPSGTIEKNIRFPFQTKYGQKSALAERGGDEQNTNLAAGTVPRLSLSAGPMG